MLNAVKPEEARRVHVRQVGPNNQRGHGQPGPPLEPGLADQRPDEAVREIVHYVSAALHPEDESPGAREMMTRRSLHGPDSSDTVHGHNCKAASEPRACANFNRCRA